MVSQKYYVLVYATREDRKAGEQEYEFDCDTLDEAHKAAGDEVSEGKYAASIYQRSGNASPSFFVASHVIPQ